MNNGSTSGLLESLQLCSEKSRREPCLQTAACSTFAGSPFTLGASPSAQSVAPVSYAMKVQQQESRAAVTSTPGVALGML